MVNKMKEEILNYELRLGPELARPVAEKSGTAKPAMKDFNEKAELKKIFALNKKIAKEKKSPEPSLVAIARYQREIVLIRQNIIQNYKKM